LNFILISTGFVGFTGPIFTAMPIFETLPLSPRSMFVRQEVPEGTEI
jgi:hypothetical protein